MTPCASDRFTRSTSLLPGFCGFAKQDITACPTHLTRLPTGYVGEKRVIDVTGINFVLLMLILTWLSCHRGGNTISSIHFSCTNATFAPTLGCAKSATRYAYVYMYACQYFYRVHFAQHYHSLSSPYVIFMAKIYGNQSRLSFLAERDDGPCGMLEAFIWRDYRSHDISRSNTYWRNWSSLLSFPVSSLFVIKQPRKQLSASYNRLFQKSK